MEPRVYNLLDKPPLDKHVTEHHTISSSLGAVYPTSTLPAIRPLHEDQAFESRPHNDDINSLTLPEIDWQALTNSLPLHPPASNATTSSHVEVIQPEPHAAFPPVAAQHKRSTKAGAPLAEVLNQASPELRTAQRPDHVAGTETRKRRKLGSPGTVTRTLPRPAPAAKKGSKRQAIPLLPPLLVPLHEPPPDAKLIPSMTNLGSGERMDKIPSREALRGRHSAATLRQSTSPARLESHEKIEEQGDHAIKSRRTRHNWSEEETSYLLRGVAKFGIGNWKKIVGCPDYQFQSRTAVDLKDRFRTCCPDEYRKAGAERPAIEEPAPVLPVKKALPKSTGCSQDVDGLNKIDHKLPDELARLGISGPFPKAHRRARRGFSVEEDEAILRGFEKYGAKWTKIQSDESLGLSSRSRTDLRDRFRNRFPDKFMETGHKYKSKDLEPPKEECEGEKNAAETHFESSDLSSVRQPTAHRTTTVMESNSMQNSFRSLTLPMADFSYLSDFNNFMPDHEDHETITLSRNIFDWADQHSRAAVAIPTVPETRVDASANHSELPATITTMDQLDQFHLNPMLALKVPLAPSSTTAVHETAIASAPVNMFPHLPLAGILNGPASLPRLTDVVTSIEADGRNKE